MFERNDEAIICRKSLIPLQIMGDQILTLRGFILLIVPVYSCKYNTQQEFLRLSGIIKFWYMCIHVHVYVFIEYILGSKF